MFTRFTPTRKASSFIALKLTWKIGIRSNSCRGLPLTRGRAFRVLALGSHRRMCLRRWTRRPFRWNWRNRRTESWSPSPHDETQCPRSETIMNIWRAYIVFDCNRVQLGLLKIYLVVQMFACRFAHSLLPRTQCSEVFAGPWALIVEQLENNTAKRQRIKRNIKITSRAFSHLQKNQ